MSARQLSRKERVQLLRAAYQEAFDQWAFSTTRLQLLIRASAASEEITAERSKVAAAQRAYREARDLLACNLVSQQTPVIPQLRIVPSQTAALLEQ